MERREFISPFASSFFEVGMLSDINMLRSNAESVSPKNLDPISSLPEREVAMPVSRSIRVILSVEFDF